MREEKEKRRLRNSMLLSCTKILHIGISAGMFVLCWHLVYRSVYSRDFFQHEDMVLYVLYAILFIQLGRTYRVFEIGMTRVSEMVYSSCLTNVIGIGILYVLVAIEQTSLLNPLPMLVLLLIQGIWNVFWSFLSDKLYFKVNKAKPTAIVYEEDKDLEKLKEIKNFDSKFQVIKLIKSPESDLHSLLQQLEGCKAVFVAGVPATLRNGIAKYCVEQDIQGYIIPHTGDVIMAGARHMQMFSVPVMRIRRAFLTPEYALVKRAFDIAASLTAILVASPLMIIVALAIWLTDRGPVLYKQVRLTRNGEEFQILKFRSMKVNAEGDGVARLASEHDDRITPVGRVIRACRMDELPQLFNILKGDMTLVGPRPERPEIAAQYEKEMPAFALRLQVKAGLTGYAQVYGRYNTQPYDKLLMDLMYINQMSILEDLKLMFATVKILFMPESTEGVEEGNTTALK